VVIGDDGTVDAAATDQLRAELVASRGDNIDLFNFGGDVETIRAACEAETHLPAPVEPTFVRAGS